MRNGILEGVHDARWLAAVRGGAHGECDVLVSGLSEAALWHAYAAAHGSSAGAGDADAARQLVLDRCGDVVRVPLQVMLAKSED